MPDPFIPLEDAWIRSHYYDVPKETAEFAGGLAGANVLDVGCGEMLSGFGLLQRQVAHVTGLDTHPARDWQALEPAGYVDAVARKLRAHGIEPAPDYPARLTHRLYDGSRFPFADRSFDFVFSWSAFEHVTDVAQVMSEIRRVLTDDGRAFIQVYPWYHCFAGSHLSDYVAEPYFHLRRPPDWVREALDRYQAQNPGQDQFLKYMYSEYLNLNRYSADAFYRDLTDAGFKVDKARLISFDLDLSRAPADIDFSSLMICGTKMLLSKRPEPDPRRTAVSGLRLTAEAQAREIADLRQSLSWRLTAPLRAAGAMFSRAVRRKS